MLTKYNKGVLYSLCYFIKGKKEQSILHKTSLVFDKQLLCTA